MKVSVERIPNSQVVLEIEVDAERVERAVDVAYRRLARRTRVPGFRPGKAPRPMVERLLGRETLLREALEDLVPQVYSEVLEQESIDAIDQPEVEIKQLEPLVVRATVPARPTVEIGDYRSLRVERPSVEVPQEEIDEALEDLRRRYALHEPVARPVQMGDIVRLGLRITVDGRTVLDEEDYELRVREGMLGGLPEFVENLLGMERDSTKEFTVEVPQDYMEPALAGKTCDFRLHVKEIREEKLPDLDDEFAREVGEGFSSLNALRERLEQDIRERHEAQAENEYHNRIVDALVEQATLEFPPVLVEREIDRMLRDRAGNQDMDRYLRQLGRSEEDVREELRPEALERVRRSLVLGKVAELEQIEVTHADIDAEIDRLTSGVGAGGDQLRALFGTEGGHEVIRRNLLTRQTLARLAAIASGEEVPQPGADVPQASPEQAAVASETPAPETTDQS